MNRRWRPAKAVVASAVILAWVVGASPGVARMVADGSGSSTTTEALQGSRDLDLDAGSRDGTPLVGAGAAWQAYPVRIVDSGWDTLMHTNGSALIRSISGTTEYLHTVILQSTNDGVYYARSSDHGKTWQKTFRLNGATQRSWVVRIAGSGSYVYTTWLRVDGGRAWIYFRRNSAHGNYAGWSDRVRLTSVDGQMGWPAIAAAGSNVYVAYVETESMTVNVRVSRDRGATWRRISLGKAANTQAYLPDPLVAAAGSYVAVFWPSAPGAWSGRVSGDGGAHWASTKTFAGTLTSATARGSRIAVAGTDASGRAWVRVRSAGSWSAARPIPVDPVVEGVSPAQGWPTVALRGTSDVGVAYIAGFAGEYKGRLRWVASTANGTSWGAAEDVPATRATDRGRPSVVWRTSDRTYVLGDEYPVPNEEDVFTSIAWKP